jgi:hypothetical protein
MRTLIAFHGEETLRARLLREAKAIRAAGNFINARSQSNPKQKVDLISWLSDSPVRALAYKEASEKIGIDQEILLTCMAVYGRLNHDYESIAQDLIASCKVGIDTSHCWDGLALWMLVDGKRNFLKQCNSESSRECILKVATLYSESCSDRKLWQKIETSCRQEAEKLQFFFEDHLDSGEPAPIGAINPEFCALWGAARAAARKGRPTYSMEWAGLILSAWFKTEQERFLMDRRKKALPYTGIRNFIASTVQQEMSQEVLDALYSILGEINV